MYASQRPDFSAQKHNWPSLAKQARSAANQSSQDGKTADESASMTVEKNPATKTELERLDLLEILSTKEAIFAEDHTPALPIGAPGEFQYLRSKARITRQRRKTAVDSFQRHIKDGPLMAQSLCLVASQGTIITVNEALTILRESTEEDLKGN